ncbi:hypothetical protein [Alloactinosynnema sp. L-07]|nr:hypothetical protein [Alloactinosynnema sp. L-07]
MVVGPRRVTTVRRRRPRRRRGAVARSDAPAARAEQARRAGGGKAGGGGGGWSLSSSCGRCTREPEGDRHRLVRRRHRHLVLDEPGLRLLRLALQVGDAALVAREPVGVHGSLSIVTASRRCALP